VADAARATLAAVPTNSPLWSVATHQLLTDAITHKHQERALRYSEEIVESPSVNFGDKIEHLELLRLAKDPGYASCLASVEAEGAQSPHTAYAVGHWMLRAEGAPQALGWLRNLPQEVQTNQPVPMVVADGLLATKDWQGILDLTEHEDWEEIDYYRFALQSYAQSTLGHKYEAESAWHKALHASAHQLTRLAWLSEVTGTWGRTDQRMEVLSEIMDEFPNEKWAPEQFAGELYHEGRTKDLEEFFAKLYAKNPDDVQLKNNVANLSLLQNSDLETSHRLAKEAYDAATNEPSFATTYAYSLFLQGRTDDALSVLNTIKPDYLRNPSIAAYYGYIEAKAGHKELARAPLQTAARVKLLPEEMEMVRTAQAAL
jgi:Flp pilus assembly protein TadD